MKANPFGILGIVLAVLSFVVCRQSLRDKPISKRIVWMLILVLPGLPSLLFAAYYLHVVPQTETFFEFRSWPGTELSSAFVGALTGVLVTFLPRPLIVLSFLVMAGIVSGPYVKPVIGPMPDSTFRDTWSGAVCLQSTQSTCGPASVATVMKNLGVTASEMDVAKGAYSYRRGTEAWYLARYVRQHGLDATFQFEDGFNPDLALPAVAGVRLGRIGHFIAILRQEGNTFIIGEPLSGQECLTKEELLKRYQFTGFYLTISKR